MNAKLTPTERQALVQALANTEPTLAKAKRFELALSAAGLAGRIQGSDANVARYFKLMAKAASPKHSVKDGGRVPFDLDLLVNCPNCGQVHLLALPEALLTTLILKRHQRA